MKFIYTILYVEDVAATLAFYEKALGLTIAMQYESGDYGELDTGETDLYALHHEVYRLILDQGVHLCILKESQGVHTEYLSRTRAEKTLKY